jgi:carbamate kinase
MSPPRLVVALGGNALLRRGERPTAEHQRHNVAVAAAALAPLAEDHQLVVSHGNGPQVGLLALQGAAYGPEDAYPLDILDAETEGMIGYLIEQELTNLLPPERRFATLLTRIEVDPADPAFAAPTKPIGPVYDEAEARALAEQRGWRVAPDGDHFRRVVPSPRPQRILEQKVIEQLVELGVIVICAGGGGIPCVRRETGELLGVEAVIDKDLASALLGRELGASALLMLTDVPAVQVGFGTPEARALRRVSPDALDAWEFAAGSMGPKVQAACEFARGSGGVAGIGRLEDVSAILAGEAGTLIDAAATETLWWEPA